MASRIKAVLLTSDKQRHIWVANKIVKDFDLAGIVSEPKSEFYKEILSKSKIVARHLKLNELYEGVYFGEYNRFPDCDRLLIDRGDINKKHSVEWVKDKKPDIIILYGTELLKDIWFNNFKDKIINMHLGLSPYYRGSGTNFWPLVNKEPEYVGTTIHIATTGIDSGDIISQVRPDIEITDTAYDIGMKAVSKGTDILIDGIRRYLNGLKPFPQKELFNRYRRIYKRRDFNEESVLTLWRNFNEGMVKKYLMNLEKRIEKVEIIIRK